MSFLAALPCWIIRIVCTLMTCIAASVLLGGKGWEEDFDPPLSERERKLVRSGVLFEMAFQLGLWITCLVANELGNTKVRVGLLTTMALTMLFAGAYGLPQWLHYGDSEDDPQYKRQIISDAGIMSCCMAAVLGGCAVAGMVAIKGEAEEVVKGKDE